MTKKMGLTPDVQDENGNWKKTVCMQGMQWNTRSYRRWSDMNSRCKVAGSVQRRQSSYVGCANKFETFNSFVDWSKQQVGYDLEEYQLDKDLLLKGNKIYSPTTCVFLPKRLNMLLVKVDTARGEFPIGVYWQKSHRKYQSRCRDGSGKSVFLGYFDSPLSAFAAYKSFKEDLIQQVAEEYKSVIDVRAYNALLEYRVEIED